MTGPTGADRGSSQVGFEVDEMYPEALAERFPVLRTLGVGFSKGFIVVLEGFL